MKELTALKKFNELYNSAAQNITQVFGGTVGYTYIAGSCFLKVYDKRLSATAGSAAYLEERLRVLDFLQHSTPLQNRICYPLRTKSGELFSEDEGYIYVAFNLIPGSAIGWAQPFQTEELTQIAEIVTALHRIDPSPVESLCPKETFDLDFCDDFIRLINDDLHRAEPRFVTVVNEYREEIFRRIDQTRGLAGELIRRGLPYVLCHTDVHGGNIMKEPDGTLRLIDWENVILAPKEADLFSFCEEDYFPMFPEHSDAHPAALLFYRLRRDLDDIWAFLCTIIYDGVEMKQADEIYGHITRICGHLKGLDK